jgi:hypothetical protein
MSDVLRQGRLTDDARAGIARDGGWQLRVEFSPPHTPTGRARRYVAVKQYGSGEAAALVCKHAARSLKRGVLVRVHAAAEDDKRGRSWLHDVQRIEAPDMPPPAWVGRNDKD